jgi:coproporphyrinogen III oxidase
VTRGPVIEKLGGMLAEAKQQPGRTGSPLVWSRFYSLDYHPKSPLVGMLHSALVLQFYEDGTGFVGGWLGVMNGTRNEQDMAQLGKVVDDRFAKFGKSPELYRQVMLRGPDKADPAYLRRPDPSGVSLYGPPIFPGDAARSYELAEGLFEQFNDAYLEIVARRAGQSYTAEDEARRDEMRKRWLTDQLFADPFSSKVVPFEVWSLSDMPPVIRF